MANLTHPHRRKQPDQGWCTAHEPLDNEADIRERGGTLEPSAVLPAISPLLREMMRRYRSLLRPLLSPFAPNSASNRTLALALISLFRALSHWDEARLRTITGDTTTPLGCPSCIQLVQQMNAIIDQEFSLIVAPDDQADPNGAEEGA